MFGPLFTNVLKRCNPEGFAQNGERSILKKPRALTEPEAMTKAVGAARADMF